MCIICIICMYMFVCMYEYTNVPHHFSHLFRLSYSLSGNDDGEYRDVWMQGTADANIIKLAQALGWLTELQLFKCRMCEESRKLLDESLHAYNSTNNNNNNNNSNSKM